MATVDMHEAMIHLSALLKRVSEGERIIIARAGKPVAVLSPFAPPSAERRPGLLKGRVRISSSFDAPLPKSLLKETE